ncbi:phosphoribosylformylglycinamidine synthase, purS protein [Helicobacter sp. CLO-3]|uniref:phosphoribosylformylglycinamidine synthase subunit PurS n=1 Tax=unclassified Helicobacter TaxID=2593540 RepID=UPI00080518AE|nr:MULTISPECIES: phosphoribosylformylglycinamidine synthase subunit PurS [unclassified Helicobacter]OBV30073.1 phosphoribosylformylglycinamidine synthase, purS protein [Helicobacter sp. CLO-3]OHU82732.1 phosphoribosylformylglycinamidine synthase, purS protein [Helicobacter sp. CLO-3]
MQAEVTINLKNGVLDPQAKAIHHAIGTLGFSQVARVVVKKQIVLELEGVDASKAKDIATEIAHDLLANPIIEDYEVRIKE